MDIIPLAQQFGLPVALLVIGLGVVYRAYTKALADKDAAYQQMLKQKDDENERLEERNAQLEARLFRVLDKGERLADLAGAPLPPPAVRRRRSEV
jgi:hypothetical protein